MRPRSVLSWSSVIRVCKDSPFAFEVDRNADVRTRLCTRECVRNKVVEVEEDDSDEDDGDDNHHGHGDDHDVDDGGEKKKNEQG